MLGHEATIVALTRAALASPVVQRAAACPRWREMYVAVPFDGITLEGYVDLVFRDDDGLVVVDYKTDAVDAETRVGRVAHYRIQAAAYALAIAAATGERVARAVLCFLDPAGGVGGGVRGRRSGGRGGRGRGPGRGRAGGAVPAAAAGAFGGLTAGRRRPRRPVRARASRERASRVPSCSDP